MSGRRPASHWLLLLCLAAMWGTSFGANKIAVSALPPTDVVAIRLGMGALVLLLILLTLRRPLPGFGKVWAYFLVMAVLGNALPFWLIAWGQVAVDSGVAGILMSIMPLATLILAHFFVEDEGLTPLRLLGFFLGFCGIVVLIGPQALLEFEGEGTALISELAILAAALCYACNTIVARRRPKSDAVVAATGTMVFAFIFLLPWAVASPIEVAAITPRVAWALLFLGVIATATATMLYFKLVTVAGPTFLSLINYLIPLWAVMVGVVLLDETPQWSALAALGLIFLGIGLSEAGRRKI